MKKIIAFVLTFTLTLPVAFAQHVLLEEEVNDYEIKKWGANCKHNIHAYTGLGFLASETEGSGMKIIYGASSAFRFGVRYKRRFTNWLSTGIDLNYNIISYRMKQYDDKILPVPTEWDKEKFVLNNLGSEYYIRLNFGRRGNFLGKFLDVGVYGNWTFNSRYIVKYEQDNGDNLSESSKTVYSNLDFIENTHYGISGRVGFNKVSLYANYRLSDLFSDGFNTVNEEKVELPRLITGLQISF